MTNRPGTLVKPWPLYDLLERDVIPEFYKRDEKGIPAAWVARMRESMAKLTPQFSSNRSVREYTEQHYLPAASTYRKRASDKGVVGKQVTNWRHIIEQKWATLHFGEMKIKADEKQYIFEVQVYLHELDPDMVLVELFADGINNLKPERYELKLISPIAGSAGFYVYRATVPATRPATDYTARIIPHFDGVAVPLEAAQILWHGS